MPILRPTGKPDLKLMVSIVVQDAFAASSAILLNFWVFGAAPITQKISKKARHPWMCVGSMTLQSQVVISGPYQQE
jgi:hypothetical protein